MLNKNISLGDIRKSLRTLNETSPTVFNVGTLNTVELTRSFFEWIIECQYDLNSAIYNLDAWVKEDNQKKEYMKMFQNGEFNQFLKFQTWAEEMEDGDN